MRRIRARSSAPVTGLGPRTVGNKVESRLPFPFSSSSKNPLSRFLLLFLLYCGYVGNAFALSKRSGISTGLAAASIRSMPARHTAVGVGFQMHFFVLDRAPQAFDEDVVHETSAPVHRNRDSCRLQLAGESGAGELRAL